MNIKKHPEFENERTIGGKKTAVFAGDTRPRGQRATRAKLRRD